MSRLTTIVPHPEKSVFPAMPSDPDAAEEEGPILSSRRLDFSDAPDIRNETYVASRERFSDLCGLTLPCAVYRRWVWRHVDGRRKDTGWRRPTLTVCCPDPF
jgi:hypothetical protein